MTNKTPAEFFEEGIDLFNHGRFFQCHEAWEEVWKRSHGAEKLFYQGLIQAAVAILHAQRGNRPGARTLWAESRAKLDRVPAEHHGLAIGELRVKLEKFFAVALSAEHPALPDPPQLERARA
jgi:predicted metal-dependent hydrolase